jgi:hypothetical protein
VEVAIALEMVDHRYAFCVPNHEDSAHPWHGFGRKPIQLRSHP